VPGFRVAVPAFAALFLWQSAALSQVTGLPWRPPSPEPRNIAGAYQPQTNPTLLPIEGGLPPFNEKGRAVYERRIKMAEAGTPETNASSECLPHGTPRLLLNSFPIFIYQVPGEVLFLHEIQHLVRHVYMDEEHPKDLDPTYLGHQVGRWDGNTLVVDTVAMNDKTSWIDVTGAPHGDQLHVVERYTKISGGRQLELLVTIDDPEFYTRPWTGRYMFDWSPNIRQMEYVCQENNRNPGGADGTTQVIHPPGAGSPD